VDFQVETQFPEHPRCYRAVCEACGVGERSPVVHVSSISIDHEDGLYTGLWLCHECVREWGRALGMLDVDQVGRIRENAEAIAVALEEAKAELARLQPVKDALELAAADWLERSTAQPEVIPVEEDVSMEEAVKVVAKAGRR